MLHRVYLCIQIEQFSRNVTLCISYDMLHGFLGESIFVVCWLFLGIRIDVYQDLSRSSDFH